MTEFQGWLLLAFLWSLVTMGAILALIGFIQLAL